MRLASLIDWGETERTFAVSFSLGRLLMATIVAARHGGVIKAANMQRVIVDTTVLPKAIAYPTDSRLLERSRQHLVKVAQDNGLALRQNYKGRYAHAKQFKRMKKALRTLRTRVMRVQREFARPIAQLPEQAQIMVVDLLDRTGRILAQRIKDNNKLYVLHAPRSNASPKARRKPPMGLV